MIGGFLVEGRAIWWQELSVRMDSGGAASAFRDRSHSGTCN